MQTSTVSFTQEQISRINTILQQNRGDVNFTGYKVSEEHHARISEYNQKIPQLKIPRASWFNHANYHDRLQMPDYHVHYR